MRRVCVFALACVRVRLLCRWRLSLCNFPADAEDLRKGSLCNTLFWRHHSAWRSLRLWVAFAVFLCVCLPVCVINTVEYIFTERSIYRPIVSRTVGLCIYLFCVFTSSVVVGCCYHQLCLGLQGIQELVVISFVQLTSGATGWATEDDGCAKGPGRAGRGAASPSTAPLAELVRG